jgi:hypothetical protein
VTVLIPMTVIAISVAMAAKMTVSAEFKDRATRAEDAVSCSDMGYG